MKGYCECDLRSCNELCGAIWTRVLFPVSNEIFVDGESDGESVVQKFRITESGGKGYNTNHYNLKAIIAEGKKVDSEWAVRF